MKYNELYIKRRRRMDSMQIRKILASFLAAAMMAGMIPSMALATEAEVVDAEVSAVETDVVTTEEALEEAPEEIEVALEEVPEEIQVALEEVPEEEVVLEEIPEETAEEVTEDAPAEELDVPEDGAEDSKEATEEPEVEEEDEKLDENVEEIIKEVTEETKEESSDEVVFELPVIDAIEKAAEEKTEEKEEEKVELLSEGEHYIADYDSFMIFLPFLEELATAYSMEVPGTDPVELVIKYIRTGVDRYNSGSWGIMAGYEDAAFAEFVVMIEEQLNAELPPEERMYISSLKNIHQFYTPNGQRVDFGHMFGTMDITNHNKSSRNHADVGGWAGDLVDLLSTADRHYVSGDMEDMVAEIREKYLAKNIDESDAFGETDMYGDIDAMYIMDALYASNNQTPISQIIAEYFTEDLSDVDRAEYFIKNRLDGETKRSAMREAVYKAYTGNKVISTLEATREFVSGNVPELRKACCYAFADYICELAGDYVELTDNRYYSVFSTETSTLAPGITQEINYALTADNKQVAYYIATADITRSDVNVYANYNNNDPSKWAMARVQDQIAAAQAKHSDPNSEHYIKDYNAIVGVNGDFFNMSTGEPSGVLVMEGVQYHAPNNNHFFAILKDGTAFIGNKSDWASVKDNVQEAIGGSALLVKNGKSVIAYDSGYTQDRASRTCVGITKSGKVVLMVLDGRQAPFSAGGAYQELAQIMIDAGCVTAINLDGGGSTTFAAKQEGEDEISIVNRPSDGFARSVSSSLLVVSTAPSSTAFDHAVIESDYDYMTVGSTLQLVAEGVSATGNRAEMPEGYTWEIDEDRAKWAEVDENGVFTAKRRGDVEVKVVVDGQVVGTKTIRIVTPDNIYFKRDKIDAVYGSKVDLPFTATYEGKAVKITDSDVELSMSTELAGTLDGFTFTGSSEGGIKVVTITVSLVSDPEVKAKLDINLYNQGEMTFDFDQATAGDRQFAWMRTISNTLTTDNVNYEVIDANVTPEASYVFALDMSQIEIPFELDDLTTMLPGSDIEGATAWTFLLQLAERISTLTEVTPVVKFDKNFYVDYTNIKVVNEYFTLKSVDYNEEENSIALTLGWNDQTQAIDPATANPMCVLSGIKLIPKADAQWTNNTLTSVVTGDITYDIYLRASALYTFANKPENQEQFGLYPFVNPDIPSEKGGHFASTYKTFSDTFTLDKTVKNGWLNVGGDVYYYENGVKLTGVQKLPEVDGGEGEFYYNLGEDGALIGLANGLFEMDGAKYYATNGELLKGWRIVTKGNEDKYYYFDYSNYKAVDGVVMIEGYEHTFVDNVLVKGAWVRNSTGLRYRWAGKWQDQGWFKAEGNDYYALRSGYVLTGLEIAKDMVNAVYKTHVFDENGVWQKQINGFYDHGADTYLVENGIVVDYPGLVYRDGYYYYFDRTNKMVKDGYYWISKNNDLIAKASNYFGPDGKMEWKAGVTKDADGEIRYYVDNVAQKAGLVADAEGNYYFINGTKKAVKNCWYAFSTANGNGLAPGGEYWFDETGKMQKKEGLYFEKNGDIRYYEDNVAQKPGLVADANGNLYFINGTRKAVKNCWYAFSDASGNGLAPSGEYWFNEKGIMQEKQGLVFEKNGDIRYYIDNVAQKAGLVTDGEGNYYFINGTRKAVKNCWYTFSDASGNGLLPGGEYWFEADGKARLKDGLYFERNGDIRYYENNVAQKAGLVTDGEGNYYFINGTRKAVKNCWYAFSTEDGHGLLPGGEYWFEADGKVQLKVGLYFEKNGDICYYENNVAQKAGLVTDGDGNYYFINGTRKAVKNCWYTFSDESGNGLLPGGEYWFNADGKIQLKDGLYFERNGDIRYYVNNVAQKPGLVTDGEGNYYFINGTRKAVKNCWYTFSDASGNGLLPGGKYFFDESGKLVL